MDGKIEILREVTGSLPVFSTKCDLGSRPGSLPPNIGPKLRVNYTIDKQRHCQSLEVHRMATLSIPR